MKNMDPLALLMGRTGQNMGLGGLGDVMGKAEDPFGLHKSGLFYSPWTNMQMAQEDAAKRNGEKGDQFLAAFNAYPSQQGY